MIIDMTKTKTERDIVELRRAIDSYPAFTSFYVAVMRIHRNCWQKEVIIAKALQSEEARQQLADAMAEPIRCGGLEYVQPVTKELVKQSFSRRGE